MEAIRQTVGNIDVLIETLESDLDVVADNRPVRRTVETGIEDQLEEAYAQAKTLMANIATDIGTEIEQLTDTARPNKLEMEFSMALSAKYGVWILSGQGEAIFKVKMTWEAAINERRS